MLTQSVWSKSAQVRGRRSLLDPVTNSYFLTLCNGLAEKYLAPRLNKLLGQTPNLRSSINHAIWTGSENKKKIVRIVRLLVGN